MGLELELNKDFNTLEELIDLLNLKIQVIEKDGVLNIYRYVGYDNDMTYAKHEYNFLYAFTDQAGHKFSEHEKMSLFNKYLETEKGRLLSIKPKMLNVFIYIDDLTISIDHEWPDVVIVYEYGSFYSNTGPHKINGFVIGPNLNNIQRL